MRIVYANAGYSHKAPRVAPAHIRQFIENATALGHELYLWHGMEQHPLTKPVPWQTSRPAEALSHRRRALLSDRVAAAQGSSGHPAALSQIVRQSAGRLGIQYGPRIRPHARRPEEKVQWWVGELGDYGAASIWPSASPTRSATTFADRSWLPPGDHDSQRIRFRFFRPDVPRVKRIEK